MAQNDKKFVPIDFTDNTSADPLAPNGTRITADRLDHIQTQHRRVSGVQVLEALPDIPATDENLAILASDGRLYLFAGGAWHKLALEG